MRALFFWGGREFRVVQACVQAAMTASGWLTTFSGDNQTTALDPLQSFVLGLSVSALRRERSVA